MNVWQKKAWIFQILCPKINLMFFVLIWHPPFFYITKKFKTCISVWVFKLVKITGGPIISGPFHKDREIYITIRRLRYNMSTLDFVMLKRLFFLKIDDFLTVFWFFFHISGPSNFSPEYKRRLCQCFEKLLGNPQMRKYFICYFSHWSISISKGMYVFLTTS